MPQTIDFFDTWQEVPDATAPTTTRSRSSGSSSSATSSRTAPFRWTLLEGAKGVQLAELGTAELARAALDRRAAARRLGPAHDDLLRLPHADGALAPLHAARAGAPWPARRGDAALNRVAFAAAHVVADPRADDRSVARLRDRLGRDDRLSPPPVVAGPRRRRGDGHGAARHGTRLADLARADPPRSLEPRATSRARRRLGRRHRPSRAGGRDSVDDVDRAPTKSRCAAIEKRRRHAHPDGEPRAGRVRRDRRTTTRASTTASWRQVARAGDPALAGRHVRPGARRLLGRRRRPRPSDRDTAPRRHRRVIARTRKVDGIKVSLLDKARRSRCAARLPAGVRMYTGDDFNYAELIARRCATGHSRRAARHLRRHRAGRDARRWPRWPRGDAHAFDAILAPTVPLSRHIFAAPTRFYKTGVVFMAWLNGHQSHFTMVGGQQSARSLAAPARALPARRRGRPAARPGARRCAACGTLLGAARHRAADADARLRAAIAGSRSTPRRCARSGQLAGHHRRLRAPRHPRHLALARPGRRGRARATRAAHPRHRARARPATAAAACSPRADARRPARRARRQPARGRRGADARRAVPGAGRRRPAEAR